MIRKGVDVFLSSVDITQGMRHQRRDWAPNFDFGIMTQIQLKTTWVQSWEPLFISVVRWCFKKASYHTLFYMKE